LESYYTGGNDSPLSQTKPPGRVPALVADR